MCLSKARFMRLKEVASASRRFPLVSPQDYRLWRSGLRRFAVRWRRAPPGLGFWSRGGVGLAGAGRGGVDESRPLNKAWGPPTRKVISATGVYLPTRNLA